MIRQNIYTYRYIKHYLDNYRQSSISTAIMINWSVRNSEFNAQFNTADHVNVGNIITHSNSLVSSTKDTEWEHYSAIVNLS